MAFFSNKGLGDIELCFKDCVRAGKSGGRRVRETGWEGGGEGREGGLEMEERGY